MTELERDNILLNLQKSIGNMETKLDKHDEMFENIQAKLDKHDEMFESIQAKLDKHDEMFENMEQKMKSMQDSIKDLQKETRSISQSVASIEFNHGEKLQVLLDIYPEFYKKFASFADNFVSHDNRLDNLEARVYSLESKVAANQ